MGELVGFYFRQSGTLFSANDGARQWYWSFYAFAVDWIYRLAEPEIVLGTRVRVKQNSNANRGRRHTTHRLLYLSFIY